MDNMVKGGDTAEMKPRERDENETEDEAQSSPDLTELRAGSRAQISPRVRDLIKQFDESALTPDPSFVETGVFASSNRLFETSQLRKRGERPAGSPPERSELISSARKLNEDLRSIVEIASSVVDVSPGGTPLNEQGPSEDLNDFETPETARRGFHPMSGQSDREQVFSSAKKLNRDLLDIKDDLTGFVSALNDISDTLPRELSLADSQSSLLASLDDEEEEKRTNPFFLDLCGGLLLSIPVVFLVMALAASQEDLFVYRPV